jgi:autotransporter-associated beta strand protein
LVLSGKNTYTGVTTVSNGTLLVNGDSSGATGLVTVNSGATLGGNGIIGGSVAVSSGGALAPGVSTGKLTVAGNVVLNAGSTSTFVVDGATPTNGVVAVGGSATYGGTLNIVPTGTFTSGQTFTLFSGAGAVSGSNFASVTGSPGAGLAFNFTNGVLSVVSTSVSPVALSGSVSGNTLTLNWPAGQGWRLEWQTNGLSTGLGTNWEPLTDGLVSSTNIILDPTKPAVFYRLVNPNP